MTVWNAFLNVLGALGFVMLAMYLAVFTVQFFRIVVKDVRQRKAENHE